MRRRAKSSQRTASGQSRTVEDSLLAVRSSIEELRYHLTFIERSGDNLACRTSASILRRLLVDELPKTKQLRHLNFRSYIDPNDEDSGFPLTTHEISEHGTRVVPNVLIHNEHQILRFHKWKNEIVFRGKPNNGHPSNEQLSKVDKSYSREAFLNFVRHEVGSHFDDEISLEFLSANRTQSFLDLKVTARDGIPVQSSAPHPHKWTYLSATVVGIGAELLKSIAVKEINGQLLLLNPVDSTQANHH